MIITKTYKSIAVALLLSFSTSVFAQALSCSEFLEESLTKREVSVDYQALEITASIALAFELKSVLANIPLITYRGIRTGKYKSVPRVKYNERKQWSANNYNFDSITPEDKARILEDLPGLMENVLRRSTFRKRRLGREFNKRFSGELTDGLLERNKDLLDDFLRDNFRAIVLNAARMPALPLASKFFLFVQRSFKVAAPAAIAAGGVTELLYPSAFFQLFLNGDQMFFQDQLYNSIDYMLITKAGLNAATLYPILSIPVGLATHGRERFDVHEYDFKEGAGVRRNYIEATVTPED